MLPCWPFLDEGTDPNTPPNPNQKVFSDEEIANIVDMVLKEDDLNHDGSV